jgi:hypothetical protein
MASQSEDAEGQSTTSYNEAFTKTPETGSGDDSADTWAAWSGERVAEEPTVNQPEDVVQAEKSEVENEPQA